MNKYFLLAITLIVFLLMVGANYASTSDIIPWLSMNNLDGVFPFPYMPPGYAFGISWGLIYLLLTIFVFSLIYRATKNYTKSTENEMLAFTGINILNISWILATSFENYWLAGVIIFFMYISLLFFVKKFGTDIYKKLGFGVYLGWITVASFSLTTAQFVYMTNSELAVSEIFGNGVLGLGLLATVFTLWFTRNPVAFIWSVLAVIVAGLRMYGIL